MATATLHTVWDCRWSQPGHRITGVPDRLQPESVWVCVREGGRRAVSEDECAACAHWEPIAAAATTIAAPPWEHAAPTDRAATRLTMAPGQGPVIALQATLVLIAAVFAAIGVAVLAGPVAIPVTVVLWLCAAAALGIAAFGPFLPR